MEKERMKYKNKRTFKELKNAFINDSNFIELFLNANGYDNVKGMGNRYAYRMSISLDQEQINHVN